MQRKKILLLGLGRDKSDFLSQLDAVEYQRNIYLVGEQKVEIVKTVEQAYPDHVCSQMLDGFDAVIQLFNGSDANAPGLQSRIPEALPSFIKVIGIDNENPAEYVKSVLNEIKDKKTYRHQESTANTPSIFDHIYSFFGTSRKQEAACPVNHTASQPFRLGVISNI